MTRAERRMQAANKQKPMQGWLKHIGKAGAPLTMILKSYSLGILFWDVALLLFNTWLAIIQSIISVVMPRKTKRLREEIALIVGSARGVGREIAIKLSNSGTTVICIDVRTSENEATVQQIRRNGGQAYYYQCDVTNKQQVEKTIDLIERDIGIISMLFHCCSLPSPRSVITEPLPIRQTLDVSVTSYFYLLDAILPHMKNNQKGHIVFLTSVAAISGFKQQIALSVSQFAIQGLYEQVTEQLRISKCDKFIKTTLVHIYPFIVSENLENDIRLRVPGFFGSIRADDAASKILDGVRRNAMEISIPNYILYLSHVLKILPRRVTFILREFFDTGVDFA